MPYFVNSQLITKKNPDGSMYFRMINLITTNPITNAGALVGGVIRGEVLSAGDEE